MKVTKANGKKEAMNFDHIDKQIIPACHGLNVDKEILNEHIKIPMTDGISTSDISKITIKTALDLIDVDVPDWTFVAARLNTYRLYHSIKHIYLDKKVSGDVYKLIKLKDYIKKASRLNLLSDWYKSYTAGDVIALDSFIDSDRDNLFDFVGSDTCITRYLLKNGLGKQIELPQHMHMAVAMYLMQNEKEKLHWAKEYYDASSQFYIVNATPINSYGRVKGGSTISCLIDSIPDSIVGIFDKYTEIATGSSLGSGWGQDWSWVRSKGSYIDGKKGVAGGKIPFLKVDNDISIAVDQRRNRPGAFSVTIHAWDIDMKDFIDLKKKNGEERRRARELFPALNIEDFIIERWMVEGSTMTLFDPYDVPDLKELYGEAFTARYTEYEEEFKTKPDRFNDFTETILVNDLFKNHIIPSMGKEGVPFLHYIGNSNRNNPHKELGIIRALNLCTEIAQPTTPAKTAVCNLGSLNLARIFKTGMTEENFSRLAYYTKLLQRGLDNSIDITKYPSEESETTQKERRSTGIGTVGEAELMANLAIRYGSDEHLELLDKIWGAIDTASREASKELAIEKGSCIIPGERNAYRLAVAPNSTSALFVGTTNSHEQAFDRIWTEENLLGSFPLTAPNINANNFPYYDSPFETETMKLIRANGVRQKHIDQAVSFNIYEDTTKVKLKASKVKEMIIEAWKVGMVSIYYFRTRAPENKKENSKTEFKVSCVGCNN